MQYTASGLTASEAAQSEVSIPGLVAAAAWAVGLVVGLIALATGHAAVAGVSLVLAIMSPWFGLAWVSHSQRRVAAARPHWVGIHSDEGVPVSKAFPSSWPGLRFMAR